MSQEDGDSPVLRDPSAVQAKFDKWRELKTKGVSFNERLIHNRAFHNPNIAVKMLEFVGVNEHGTNLPLEVYDPNDFPMDADYEAIAHAQRAKWEESNKPRPTTIASQPRTFAVSKKHQLMLERFHSRDPKK